MTIHKLRREKISFARDEDKVEFSFFKETTVAWIAGLLEGEGSFTWDRDHNRPVVQIKMTDEDVIRNAAVAMGAQDISIRIAKGEREGWKESYRILLRGRRAAEVMEMVLPYMGKRRRERIEELLRYWYRGFAEDDVNGVKVE